MKPRCRSCHAELSLTFCDLGETPFANSYLKTQNEKECSFPLHAFLCSECQLVQLGEFRTPDEIFGHYAYFSSYSDSWVQHAKVYAETMAERFALNESSQVIEVASNDGYLLQHFKNLNIPILGIEPAANVAEVAEKKGIPTLVQFFGLTNAQKLPCQADLLLGNNVLAHVPDLNDFIAGLKYTLKPTGVLTIEFPHLLQLIQQNQFDTIYHEHFSYFSLFSVEKAFLRHNLELFDVEELPTHGGSLRIYMQHVGGPHVKTERIDQLREKEKQVGMDRKDPYEAFITKCETIRNQLVAFLQNAKTEGKTVVGYGAPAKGNTLLNYCRISTDLIPFTVDRNPHKQNLFLPGTRIPIHSPEKIDAIKPNYVLLLPWNLSKEIMQQMAHIRNWGAQFVIPIPELKIV